ncbi:MAG: hypothetical protein SFW64_00795 [Alphaproteobacteria bacterium]|nr:hypothetical protein [Alphaproteobacteria bacterium]
MIDIVAVSDARGRRDFIRLPRLAYRDDAQFIPRLDVEMRTHLSAKNPYFAHAAHQLFVAYENARPVGRISAQIDQMAQRAGEPVVGHFGFLDAVRPEIVAPLLVAAEAWLKQRGAARVVGPYSFSINDESGLLVEGFDHPPYLLMNHAPAWMGAEVEVAGYAPVRDLLAFHMDTRTPFPRAATRLAEQAHTIAGLTQRPLRLRDLSADLTQMLMIYNEAWCDNWGFIPMTPAETAYMAHNLKPLLIPELAQIASVDGEPAAMIMALPNIMESIRDLRGRLLPWGWLKLALRLKWRGARSVRVLLMGIRPQFRSGVTGAALSAKLISDVRTACLARNIRWVEMSWILDDNTPMIRLIEAVGGHCYKRYRLYEKGLA